MTYEWLDDLPALISDKIITKRKHPHLPIFIYNYGKRALSISPDDWPPALQDCRGLVLDGDGEIVARPFKKFWNYDQVAHRIPDLPFTVWEKLDGSLGIVFSYRGERVVATRGSFESRQAKWGSEFFWRNHPDFIPTLTYLFEFIFPTNRIVVDYHGREDAVLLATRSTDGSDLWDVFDVTRRFTKAKRYHGIRDFKAIIEDPRFADEEGFVVSWSNGFRAKIKLPEYCRIHRLITNTSTRTVWDMLRNGMSTEELLDRVPEEFRVWVQTCIANLVYQHQILDSQLRQDFNNFIESPEYTVFMKTNPDHRAARSFFAQWAKFQPHFGILFMLLDNRDPKKISDEIWKIVEPAWATPFNPEDEE